MLNFALHYLQPEWETEFRPEMTEMLKSLMVRVLGSIRVRTCRRLTSALTTVCVYLCSHSLRRLGRCWCGERPRHSTTCPTGASGRPGSSVRTLIQSALPFMNHVTPRLDFLNLFVPQTVLRSNSDTLVLPSYIGARHWSASGDFRRVQGPLPHTAFPARQLPAVPRQGRHQSRGGEWPSTLPFVRKPRLACHLLWASLSPSAPPPSSL